LYIHNGQGIFYQASRICSTCESHMFRDYPLPAGENFKVQCIKCKRLLDVQ
jgi:hypothetical protein